MAYKYNGKIIRAGRAWSNDEGIQHPRNWMIWSDAEKTAAGLVWEDDPAPFDNRFYWAADIPRALDDVTEEDGSVTLGLKSQYKAQTKATAGSLLAPTDWHVVKAAEISSYTIPAYITQYRIDVRAASNTIEAAIDGAADLDAFIALFDAPEDGNAPINDWPEEE
jgi:hypothetical protein